MALVIRDLRGVVDDDEAVRLNVLHDGDHVILRDGDAACSAALPGAVEEYSRPQMWCAVRVVIECQNILIRYLIVYDALVLLIIPIRFCLLGCHELVVILRVRIANPVVGIVYLHIGNGTAG